MTQQNRNRPPILSKDERSSRERDDATAAAGLNGGGDVSSGVPDADRDPLEGVREQALQMGYVLHRAPRTRRPRPEVREGRVPTTCRLIPEVRALMDQARLELNLSHSDMVNAGVIMFLESQNLRVDADLKRFLPPVR